jgi:hypothetical protein
MVDGLNSEYENGVDLKINAALNYFWIGYILYVVCFIYPASTKQAFYICQGLQILGFIMFIAAAITILEWKFSTNYLRIVFILFSLWSLTIILRGFQLNYGFIKEQLVNAMFGIFIYFAPFVILFPLKIQNFKKIFDVILALGVVYIFYSLFFHKVLLWGFGGSRVSTGTIEYFSHFLSIPSGFLLLTYVYHSNKKNLISLSVIILMFVLSAIRGRRSLMFMSVSILLASYFIYYFTNKGKILRIISSIFLVLIIFIYCREIYFKNKGGTFGLITGRLSEDTRSGVEDYFRSNMILTDWVIGRGIDGKYFCPGIDEVAGTITEYRTVVETGYLQIILKGGLISIVLYLLLAIPAIIKGLFHSKNILSKAAAIWILLFIIYSYPVTINGFTMNYLLIWFSFGICYSSEIRNMDDESIKWYLNIKV